MQSRIANYTYTKPFTTDILPGSLSNSIRIKIYLKINFRHINPLLDKVLLIYISKHKETKLRIHNITVKAALKFGSEAWVLKKREEQWLEAAQVKFLRHLLRITKLDDEKNQCIRQKTGVWNVVKEIKQYQKKWLQHVRRMDTNRLPKQALQYKPKGQRNIGWPRKRWRDQLHLKGQGTGNMPNPSGTWWWWWTQSLTSGKHATFKDHMVNDI